MVFNKCFMEKYEKKITVIKCTLNYLTVWRGAKYKLSFTCIFKKVCFALKKYTLLYVQSKLTFI